MSAGIVLCNWAPQQLSTHCIAMEFGALMRKLGLHWDSDSDIGPRTPYMCRREAVDNKATAWHQDAHNGYLPVIQVFWSNRMLPEIRLKSTRETLEAKEGDIVLVWNRLAEHRTPQSAKTCTDRFLCQAWISSLDQCGPGWVLVSQARNPSANGSGSPAARRGWGS